MLPLETEGLVTESSKAGFKLMPVILDDMRSDEVLVEMKYSGICHTDIVGASGGYDYILDFPAALGHEGAGFIRAVGADVQNPALKVGSAVILSFTHCGNCGNCSAGHPACCDNFEILNCGAKRLDGSVTGRLADGRRLVGQFFGQSSFLKHSIVSQHSVVPCPYPEDLALYSALGCGFQTGAGTVLNSLRPSAGNSVVVFGVGTVGMSAIMGAKYLGVRQIIAVDVAESKLELARELGATHVLNSRKVADMVKEIRDICPGGVRFAIECAGIDVLMEQMLDCVCCGGIAAVVGVPKPDFVLKVDPMRLLHENKTLKGICQGDSVADKFIPEMMEMHRSGSFPLEKLCKFYDVEDYEQVLRDISEGKVLKAILKW
ncbi:NAD(P)-binding protein [Coniochaeta ligniaria NRRL 30616]|uniref:NAD(P)-binding protein n=1 Tax=Coniochaeta ligniaria NRRL 30616 TaxID=1408157 RepID=A0A1J7JMA3_9PEZI|nr:NAD(P)-binding protein [Coniochaeta ligniaria NRRL 30616]